MKVKFSTKFKVHVQDHPCIWHAFRRQKQRERTPFVRQWTCQPLSRFLDLMHIMLNAECWPWNETGLMFEFDKYVISSPISAAETAGDLLRFIVFIGDHAFVVRRKLTFHWTIEIRRKTSTSPSTRHECHYCVYMKRGKIYFWAWMSLHPMSFIINSQRQVCQ